MFLNTALLSYSFGLGGASLYGISVCKSKFYGCLVLQQVKEEQKDAHWSSLFKHSQVY